MIPFEPKKLKVQFEHIKSATTALGGSITVVDAAASTPEKEVYRRIPVPMAVARSFVGKVSNKFLTPMLIAVTTYGDHVISLEAHPLRNMGVLEQEEDGRIHTWNPNSAINIQKLQAKTTGGNDKWYFDGRYVYKFAHSGTPERPLTSDGAFKAVVVDSYDLQHLEIKDAVEQTQARDCISFQTTKGDIAFSPPIWRSIRDVGSATDSSDDEQSSRVTSEDLDRLYFDKLNEDKRVNVMFVLKAGNVLGNMFGYDIVEPLQLPRLMIELKTVSLPTLPKAIKYQYDCGMEFTQAMAWLLGLSKRINTLDTYIVMRSLMKYLGTKGLFSESKFKQENVFLPGQTLEDVPILSLADTLKKFGQSEARLKSLEQQVQEARRAKRTR